MAVCPRTSQMSATQSATTPTARQRFFGLTGTRSGLPPVCGTSVRSAGLEWARNPLDGYRQPSCTSPLGMIRAMCDQVRNPSLAQAAQSKPRRQTERIRNALVRVSAAVTGTSPPSYAASSELDRNQAGRESSVGPYHPGRAMCGTSSPAIIRGRAESVGAA
jgi:hypothetical protein